MIAPGRATSHRRRCASALALALTAGALAACGSSAGSAGSSTPTLTWYVGPDRVDAAGLARTCTTAAAGDYAVQVKQLPTGSTERHASLGRRLASGDGSIDLLSVDSAWTAEFAAAGFFAPLPAAEATEFSAGIAPAALDAATFRDKLVVAPWFMDPQLLWFRGNTAERAGLDTTKPITWDDLVAGADRLGVSVDFFDRDGSGLSEWVNALVVASGGTVVDGPGRKATIGLDTDAGRSAASVVQFFRDAGVGPGPSGDALSDFAAAAGGFLVAPSSVIADPALSAVVDDLGWTAYPVVDGAVVAPLAGVGLGVPADAERPALSYRAITCLTSTEALGNLVARSGHAASRLSTYDESTVKAAAPTAETVLKAVASGRTVPVTPYWQRVVAALDDTWTPLSGVDQDVTPGESQRAVRAAVAGRLR